MSIILLILAIILLWVTYEVTVAQEQTQALEQVVVYVCHDMDDNQDCQEYETPVERFTLHYRSDGTDWRLRKIEGRDGVAIIPFLSVFRKIDIYVTPSGGLPSHVVSLDVNWHDHIIYGPTEVTFALTPTLYLPLVEQTAN